MHFLWERDTKTEATSWISVCIFSTGIYSTYLVNVTDRVFWTFRILFISRTTAGNWSVLTIHHAHLMHGFVAKEIDLQEEGISLSGGWEMFPSSQGADFYLVLRSHMSLCFVFRSPLSFLRGTEPMSLFFSRRELRKTVGTFWFWVSSLHTGPGNDLFQVI